MYVRLLWKSVSIYILIIVVQRQSYFITFLPGKITNTDVLFCDIIKIIFLAICVAFVPFDAIILCVYYYY